MTEIICTGITGIVGLLCAVIELRARRTQKQTDAERAAAERRAVCRAEESRLSMELMSANCKLALVTAKAVTGRRTNGDVEEAMEAAADAQTKYSDFLRRTAAGEVAKA